MTTDAIYRLLAHHDFFKYFEGHPGVIRLIASMTKDKKLTQLHNQMKSKRLNWVAGEGHPYHAMITSIEASINNLNSKRPEAIQLFYLISLMPGGVSRYDLE